MDNSKPDIKEELDHIKNSINKKSEKPIDDDNFILLNKIISKSKKTEYKNKKEFTEKDSQEINNKESHNKTFKTGKKINNSKKNITNKISNSVKKPKDPVATLVDREIKPIIKKWIGKNLKSFVKSIVIEEIKLISKATQKHK